MIAQDACVPPADDATICTATSEHDPPEKVKDTVPVQQAPSVPDASRNSAGADRLDLQHKRAA